MIGILEAAGGDVFRGESAADGWTVKSDAKMRVLVLAETGVDNGAKAVSASRPHDAALSYTEILERLSHFQSLRKLSFR